MTGETERQLSACRVSHHCQMFRAEMELRRIFANEPVCRPEVRKRPRPPATVVAHAAIFDVEGRYATRAQSLAQVPSVSKIVLCPPIAAVDVDENGVRAPRVRQTYFEELV